MIGEAGRLPLYSKNTEWRARRHEGVSPRKMTVLALTWGRGGFRLRLVYGSAVAH
jgi:hypothetical protein